MNRRSFLISAAAVGASVVVAGSAQASGATHVVDAPWGLNLRTGPGTHYDVIKSLPNGTHVTKIKQHGGWVKIHLASGHVGWVSGQYLKKAHGGGHGGYSVWAVVNLPYGGCIYLRTGPGNGYGIVKQLSHGDKVEILAKSGSWRKVRHAHSGKVGWTEGAYLVS